MDIDEVLSLLKDNGAFSSISPPSTLNFQKPRVNPFLLISDQYHKENLHTDIIKYLLDPEGDHNCRDHFLHLFINFLCLNIDDFTNPKVSKQKGAGGGFMDIFISGMGKNGAKNVIIFENEIFDAPDTPMQLPTYFHSLSDEGFTVLKIVYLSLNGYKEPSTTGWKPEEIDKILDLKISIAAYNNYPNDLVNGWLEKCRIDLNDHDVNLFLKHYIDILKFRRGNIMNENDLNKLLDFIKDEKGKVQVEYLVSLFNNIGVIRAKNLLQFLDEHPENSLPFKTRLFNGILSVVLKDFSFKDNIITLTIDFPPTCNGTQIRFRMFDSGNGTAFAPEIIDVLSSYSFVSDSDRNNDFIMRLNEEESLPSNEAILLKKVIDLNNALFSAISRPVQLES